MAIDGGPASKTAYAFDQLGRITKVVTVGGDGVEHETARYAYDELGIKTKMEAIAEPSNIAGTCGPGGCGTVYGVEGADQAYGANGVALITTLYDESERPREAIFSDTTGAAVLRVVLTRDEQGRLVKEASQCGERPPFPIGEIIDNAPEEERTAAAAALAQLFGPEKEFSCTTYLYDSLGRRIERCASLSELGREQTTWEYDENDNPVREVQKHNSVELDSDATGHLRSKNPKSFKTEVQYEYKYDRWGNWTERIVSFRNEGNASFQRSNIYRREINYESYA